MTIEECCESLKAYIVEDLRLEDVELASLHDDSPLFGYEGLGLDSLDAVELVVLVEKRYGVKIKSAEEAAIVFVSVRTLAAYIMEKSAS